MLYRLLADLLVALHLGFILFAVFGGLLAVRWPRIAWAHGIALAWAASVEVFGLTCPLTPLEVALRLEAGLEGYSGGFIERYLVPVVYPPGLSRTVQWVLAGGLILVNAGVYGWVWRRLRAAAVTDARSDPAPLRSR